MPGRGSYAFGWMYAMWIFAGQGATAHPRISMSEPLNAEMLSFKSRPAAGAAASAPPRRRRSVRPQPSPTPGREASRAPRSPRLRCAARHPALRDEQVQPLHQAAGTHVEIEHLADVVQAVARFPFGFRQHGRARPVVVGLAVERLLRAAGAGEPERDPLELEPFVGKRFAPAGTVGAAPLTQLSPLLTTDPVPAPAGSDSA